MGKVATGESENKCYERMTNEHMRVWRESGVNRAKCAHPCWQGIHERKRTQMLRVAMGTFEKFELCRQLQIGRKAF